MLADLARALQTPARLSAGFTTADAVRDYADFRRVVIDLAGEGTPRLSPAESGALERAEVRLDTRLHHRELVPLGELVEEAGVAAALEAAARGATSSSARIRRGRTTAC